MILNRSLVLAFSVLVLTASGFQALPGIRRCPRTFSVRAAGANGDTQAHLATAPAVLMPRTEAIGNGNILLLDTPAEAFLACYQGRSKL
jgi:hypothetical protein